MALVPGAKVLRGIFELRRRLLPALEAPQPELWEADPGDGSSVLIKAWPFIQERPGPIEQTMWDRELRILYRLASTPEAERRLVTLIDATVDRQSGAFVLALKVPGVTRLSDVIARRAQYGWLSTTDPTNRARLWRGVLKLVEGLAHVHRLRSLHSSVQPENIFLDEARGPESFRLSGFEWSTRLGVGGRRPITGSFVAQTNASLNADWHDLGVVLAKLFGIHPTTPLANGSPNQLLQTLRENTRLTDDEKSFIHLLLLANGTGPIDRTDLEESCRQVIESLERPVRIRRNEYFAVVATFQRHFTPTDLARRIAEIDPSVSATDTEERLRIWLEEDLYDAPIFVSSSDVDARHYFLKGRRLAYRLRQYRPSNAGPSTWAAAYVLPTEYVDERFGRTAYMPAPGLIRVYSQLTAQKSFEQITKAAVSWDNVLPVPSEPEPSPAPQLEFLRRFLEVTNHIEREIRETEIYSVDVLDHRVDADGTREYLTIRESRIGRALPMSDRSVRLIRYLDEEDSKDAEKPVLVWIGPEPQLEDVEVEQDDPQLWEVSTWPQRDDEDRPQLVLQRSTLPYVADERPQYLRSASIQGQLALLSRRDDAISLLGTHTFLQRALTLPDTVYIDTGIDRLPLPPPPVSEFDAPKQSALRQIWRTRPIFCLQGPPGTGKTKLIAELARQIYEDDPSCQVLLTAQAHPAVDHLRDEVRKMVDKRLADEPTWVPPLAVRLSRKGAATRQGRRHYDSANPTVVALGLLEKCLTALEARATSPEHLTEWHEYVAAQVDAMSRRVEDGARVDRDVDFEWLVRRSANFVYCTSTADNLLWLARSHQTFDWSIIEEAGKAHGFDLVLPLQTGHRWVLIGDQKQLFPYRDEDFKFALERLDAVTDSDRDLRRFWSKLEAHEHSAFKADAQKWLYFFREIFGNTERRIVRGLPLVDMLKSQHRMHPAIGDLVSHAFYDDSLKSDTKDELGRPKTDVVHRFVTPPEFHGRAVAWLDVPQIKAGSNADKEGHRVNHAEIDAIMTMLAGMTTVSPRKESVAILTPYRLQRKALIERVRRSVPPDWAIPPDGPDSEPPRLEVFTVDSFQGRQASTVIISLVRNNDDKFTPDALGFLRFFERVNVMLSRAERLLILVGSWDFFSAHLKAQSDKPGQPYRELRRMIDWLERAIVEKRAVKI